MLLRNKHFPRHQSQTEGWHGMVKLNGDSLCLATRHEDLCSTIKQRHAQSLLLLACQLTGDWLLDPTKRFRSHNPQDAFRACIDSRPQTETKTKITTKSILSFSFSSPSWQEFKHRRNSVTVGGTAEQA